jgi:ADP-ribose pyrophosphatase
VRRYRPALERFTWELPTGMVDTGETAACCARELKEETGLEARAVHALGDYAPCTARLSNRIHSFFVETGPHDAGRSIEQGIELRLATPAEIAGLIRSGEFVLQLHVGVLLLAGLHGHIDLGAFDGTAGTALQG